MELNDERDAKGKPRVPSAEDAAEKWRRNAQAAAPDYGAAMAADARRRAEAGDADPLRLLARLVKSTHEELARLVRNSDHIHDDVVALREVANIPRPECYPQAARQRGARRARRRASPGNPPAPSPPETTSPSEA